MNARILLLDAVATNRIVMTSKLSTAHYSVIASDGGAWESLLGLDTGDVVRLPDVIVLDANVSPGHGLDLCRTLRNAARVAQIPILFTRDARAPVDVADAFDAGADDVITRPFHAQVLLARLRGLTWLQPVPGAPDLRDPAGSVRNAPLPQPRCGLVCDHSRGPVDPLATLCAEFDPNISLMNWHDVFLIEEQTNAHDLLIIRTDPQNPRDTLNMIAELRSRRTWRDVGVILVAASDGQSASVSPGTFIADALNIGADDVVAHDVCKSELMARLHRQAGLKNQRDRLKLRVQSNMRLAVTDPLTGLKNRRFAADRLVEIARQANMTGGGFAVLMLDVDHFKLVNDRFGHAVGDTVLRKIATTLQANLRDTDLLARIGGEEFLVALPMSEPAIAANTAERLRNVVQKLRFAISGAQEELAVTLSIGMVFNNGSGTIETLLEQADQALYCAKASGRNIVNIAA